MKLIGFKNFRKFEDFPPIALGPITIFVGENNAGKSTVVKAILAIIDFLKSPVDPRSHSLLDVRFSFNSSYFTHIGTFARALYNKTADENNSITFHIGLDSYLLDIVVEGDKDDNTSVSAQLAYMIIVNTDYNYKLEYNFKKDNIHATFFHRPYCENDNTTSDRFLKRYFKDLTQDIEMDMPISNNVLLNGNIIDSLFQTFQARLDVTLGSVLSNRTLSRITMAELGNLAPIQGLSDSAKAFLSSKKTFLQSLAATSRSLIGASPIFNENIEYIYAHAITQTVVYSAKDINDYFVKTVHEFANERIVEGTTVHSFILKWMREFKIGESYSLDSLGGEAHIVRIKNLDGTYVNLADKGMGSIQMMILLFRLATKMSQSNVDFGEQIKDSTIIVEEPEQNLHPMLQSKLAELFFSMNQDYGFRFIIETHSEYLIRRTQALVGSSYRDKKGFENPFKVYYFPANGTPYDMPYAKTGRFEEQFGSGFFDEATKWNREVLRNENAK